MLLPKKVPSPAGKAEVQQLADPPAQRDTECSVPGQWVVARRLPGPSRGFFYFLFLEARGTGPSPRIASGSHPEERELSRVRLWLTQCDLWGRAKCPLPSLSLRHWPRPPVLPKTS